MATVSLSPVFNGYQSFLATGLPNSFGFIKTYAAGSSTPLATYSDSGGSVPNAVAIPLNASGYPPNEIWLDATLSYKFVITDTNANVIGTYDNIVGYQSLSVFSASNGSSLIGFIQSGTGAVATTVQDALGELVDNYKPMQDYAELRSYTGPSTGVRITGVLATAQPQGIAGQFIKDTTDTTSGCVFTGSVSGTTLTAGTPTNGTLVLYQSICRPDTGAFIGYITALGTGTGGAGTYTLSASATVASMTLHADNGGTVILDGNGVRWKRQFSGAVSVKWFSAVGDGGADTQAEIQSAINALPTGGELYFPPGLYKTTIPLTINKVIKCFGAGISSFIRCTAATNTPAILIDGTGVANGLRGVAVEDLGIATELGGGDAIKLIFVDSSRFSNISIPSCAGAGIRSLGGAYNTYIGVSISQNLPYTVGARVIPVMGVSLEVDPVSTVPSGHNTFVTLQVEGASTGVGYGVSLADTASHNTFVGGNLTSCNIGMVIAAGGQLNTVYSMVLESNNTLDYSVAGSMNTFVNCQGMSIAGGGAAGGPILLTGSYSNNFIGGRYRNFQINAGCTGTLLKGISVFTGVTDNGVATQIESVWEMTSGKYLPTTIQTPGVGSGSGMFSIKDSTNKNRRLSFGFDSTVLTNGSGYVQATVDGTANVPLLLNPSGGKVAAGTPTADPGGSNNLALPPAIAPTSNHTGVTIYTTDGLSINFLDKNGVVRSISFV